MGDDGIEFPPHVALLLSQLRVLPNTTSILLQFAKYTQNDAALYQVYKQLGYSYELGRFSMQVVGDEIVNMIKTEYKCPYDYEAFQSDAAEQVQGIMDTLNQTFIQAEVSKFASPLSLGIKGQLQYEDDESDEDQKVKTKVPRYRRPVNLKPRSSRGLKTLSVRVRHIVCEKKCTSYKDVADSLIMELELQRIPDGMKNEKNIRRRVYDALNVLVASSMVAKRGKSVVWLGRMQQIEKKSEKQEESNEKRTQEIQDRIQYKKRMLKKILVRVLSVQELIRRNSKTPRYIEAVPFPFILVAVQDKDQGSLSTEIDHMYTSIRMKFHHKFVSLTDIELLLHLKFYKNTSPTELPIELLNTIGDGNLDGNSILKRVFSEIKGDLQFKIQPCQK